MGNGRPLVGNFEGLDYCDGIFLHFYVYSSECGFVVTRGYYKFDENFCMTFV